MVCVPCLRCKILNVLRICHQHNRKTMIFGAWGCSHGGKHEASFANVFRQVLFDTPELHGAFHRVSQKFGPTDLAQRGIENFFMHHKCGRWCSPKSPLHVGHAADGGHLKSLVSRHVRANCFLRINTFRVS